MRLLRRILKAKREEVTKALRKICERELHKFYFSPEIRMSTEGRNCLGI
jgi:hypothetical protein